MIIIEHISDSEHFTLNGKKYPRIYQAVAMGITDIAIYNVHDIKNRIQNNIHYSEVMVNNTQYSNQGALIEALIPILYTKNIITGAKGDTGPKGDTPEHTWSGTSLSFENPDGSTGIAVDLKGERGLNGEKGQKGDQGIQGIQGVKGDKGNKGDTGERGIQGIEGEKGQKGDKGDIGDSAYNVWLSLGNTGTEQDFIDSIKGEDGAIGSDGADGDSAYQVWLNAGNTGSQQDFIDSLTGPQGPKGDTGETGPQGETGQDGEDATKDPIPFKTLTSPANEIDFAGDNLELYNWLAPTDEISFTLTNLRAGVQRIIRVQNATAVGSEILINGDGSASFIGNTDNWFTDEIMEISIFGLSTTTYEWWYNKKER